VSCLASLSDIYISGCLQSVTRVLQRHTTLP
jgi:hypothetical protein